MQTAVLPFAALILAFMLWITRKPSKPLIKNLDASKVAGLNRTQLSLVLETQLSENFEFSENFTFTTPIGQRQRVELRNRLIKQMGGSPEERLEAIQIISVWGHQSVLHLLERGLRDADYRVVKESAVCLERYKGHFNSNIKYQETPPPRNVARMR